MTQLVLILGINLAGLTFAIAMARWASMRETVNAEVRRLGNAVERATGSFLAGCFRQVALIMTLVASVLGALHLYVWDSGTSESMRYVVWSLLGLLVGAVLTCVVVHFAVLLAHRASMNAVLALRLSSDRTLSVAMRAGGSLGLLSECVGVLGVCLLFSLLVALTGGGPSAPVATGAAYVFGGFALGAALAALVVQRSGSVYRSASEIGAELGGERDADLRSSDPRNPAAVARLVGDHVGRTASRAVDLFVCTSLANTAVLLVGARVYAKELGEGTFGLLLLPVVVKSFGVLASAFGIMVARTDENADPAFGIWRGSATTAVICLGALLGSTLWLIGQPQWPPFFIAGSLGLLVAAATAYGGTQRLQRRLPSMRAVVDALKVGDAAVLAEALALGLGAAVFPSLFATVALVMAWHLGQATTVAEGGALAVALALMSMLASGPFMLAASTLGSVTDSARAIARITGTKPNNEDFERRAGRLEEAGSFADTFAQSFWILVAGVAALFVAGALLTPTAVQLDEKLNLAHPAITYAALLGAVLVLVYAGGVLGAASRSMRGVVAELQRQLRGFPKERGKSQVPTDYIPSYRACIEIVAKSALSRHLVPVLLAVLLPLLLGPFISVATAASPATVRAALATFVLASAVTGLTASFAAEAVRTCVGSIRRQARGKPGGAEAGIHAHGFAELFGGAAGPAALLVFKTAAVGTLAVAPFLS